MKARNTNRGGARKRPVSPSAGDAAIIAACVRFSANLAASSAAFKADPDGEWKDAKPLQRRLLPLIAADLKAATAQAHTIAGIHAKARMLKLLEGLDPLSGDGSCEPAEVDFILSVSRDVSALLDKWDSFKPRAAQ